MIDPIWQKIKETSRLEHRKVVFFETTDSTNTQALDLAKKGAPAGSLVVAETQTKGRGRLQREWLSPPGDGLYFSLIWHSRLSPRHLAKTTLAVGLGLCRAVAAETGLGPLIKWPNDLLLESKKIGGILIENCGRAGDNSLIIIGVGLNVNTEQCSFSPELAEKASSLFISAQKTFRRGDLLVAALRGIENELNRLEAGEIEAVLNDFRKEDATLGKTMEWLTPARERVTGVSLGIDADGLLQVQDGSGQVHAVMSGDINLAGLDS